MSWSRKVNGKRRSQGSSSRKWLVLEVWDALRPWLKALLVDHAKVFVCLVLLFSFTWLITAFFDGLERTILLAVHFINVLIVSIRRTPPAV
jgi:hypothetical protein